MSEATLPIHHPAPAPDGPIACTLAPTLFAERIREFREGVFDHLIWMERPAPHRLRLLLSATADPELVHDLLRREQACCAFLGVTLSDMTDGLVADLEVPEHAAAALDGLVSLAELARR